jgi:prepilin-type N-terminal cleavage/methylation domain-containing protein
VQIRTSSMPTRTHRPAFTLIEVLVVVGIITAVIAILLPALKKARSAAQAAQCLSNLRNLAASVQTYEYDNHGQLVVSQSSASLSYFFSYTVVADEAQNCSKVQICPATLDYGNADYTQRDAITVNSYGWNWWIQSFVQQSQALPPAPSNAVTLKPGTVRDASEVVLVADIMQTVNTGLSINGGGDGNVFDPFTIPGVNGNRQTPTQTLGNGSVLWLDGHASLEPAIPVPPSTPYNSSGNGNYVYELQLPPSYYNQNHIGYLARSATDLTSMNSEYYFVFQKEALASNTIAPYLDSSKALWK